MKELNLKSNLSLKVNLKVVAGSLRVPLSKFAPSILKTSPKKAYQINLKFALDSSTNQLTLGHGETKPCAVVAALETGSVRPAAARLDVKWMSPSHQKKNCISEGFYSLHFPMTMGQRCPR